MRTATSLRNPKCRAAVFHRLDLSAAVSAATLILPSVFDENWTEKAEAIVGEAWEAQNEGPNE